jgi:adenylate cyclase
MVATTSSAVGAHKIHTVLGAGSSMLFSNASAPRSVIRSASSMTMTCHRPRVGLMADRRTSSRTSSTPIESNSVRTNVTSGWAPDNDVRHSVQCPQPPELHCSAAAKARAAFERPEPGGPVNNQAWLMACGSPATARCKAATAAV